MPNCLHPALAEAPSPNGATWRGWLCCSERTTRVSQWYAHRWRALKLRCDLIPQCFQKSYPIAQRPWRFGSRNSKPINANTVKHCLCDWTELKHGQKTEIVKNHSTTIIAINSYNIQCVHTSVNRQKRLLVSRMPAQISGIHLSAKIFWAAQYPAKIPESFDLTGPKPDSSYGKRSGQSVISS